MFSISLPEYIPGYVNLMWPLAESSLGPVNTSPSGKLACPLQFNHFLPFTERVKSVSSPITCILSTLFKYSTITS